MKLLPAVPSCAAWERFNTLALVMINRGAVCPELQDDELWYTAMTWLAKVAESLLNQESCLYASNP